METLRELSRWSHIILGFTGLLAFWFPVVARKGGRLHRIAGQVFVWCGYGVTATAALSVTLVTAMIIQRDAVATNLQTLAQLLFLGYLAWVTFVSVRYAVGVLATKKDPTLLATAEFRFLAWSSIAASGMLIAYAALVPTDWSLLLFVLSPIGIATGMPILKYMRGGFASSRQWFYEHMSATLGAGIAFHTAFAVFGAARLFSLPSTGMLSILPWILPTLIGVPGQILWKRHYQRKFGELPARSAIAGEPVTGAQ